MGRGGKTKGMCFCFQILPCRFLDVADDLTLLLFLPSRQQTKDPRKELATTLSEARLQIHKAKTRMIKTTRRSDLGAGSTTMGHIQKQLERTAQNRGLEN